MRTYKARINSNKNVCLLLTELRNNQQVINYCKSLHSDIRIFKLKKRI